MGITSATAAASRYKDEEQQPAEQDAKQNTQKQPSGAQQAFDLVNKGMDLLMNGLQQTGTKMSEWGQTKAGVSPNLGTYAVNVAGEAMDLTGGIGKGIGAMINGADQWGKNAQDLAKGEFNLKDATAATVSSAGKFAYGTVSGAGDLATRLLAPGAGHNAYEKRANGLQQQMTKGYEGQVGKLGVNTKSKTYDTVEKGADVLSSFLPTPGGKTKTGRALTKVDNAADAGKTGAASRVANSTDNVNNLGTAVSDFKAGKIDKKQLNEALANANDAYKQGGGKADWDAQTRSDFKSHSNDAHAAMASTRPASGAPAGVARATAEEAPAGNATRGSANGKPVPVQAQPSSLRDVSLQDSGVMVKSSVNVQRTAPKSASSLTPEQRRIADLMHAHMADPSKPMPSMQESRDAFNKPRRTDTDFTAGDLQMNANRQNSPRGEFSLSDTFGGDVAKIRRGKDDMSVDAVVQRQTQVLRAPLARADNDGVAAARAGDVSNQKMQDALDWASSMTYTNDSRRFARAEQEALAKNFLRTVDSAMGSHMASTHIDLSTFDHQVRIDGVGAVDGPVGTAGSTGAWRAGDASFAKDAVPTSTLFESAVPIARNLAPAYDQARQLASGSPSTGTPIHVTVNLSDPIVVRDAIVDPTKPASGAFEPGTLVIDRSISEITFTFNQSSSGHIRPATVVPGIPSYAGTVPGRHGTIAGQ